MDQDLLAFLVLLKEDGVLRKVWLERDGDTILVLAEVLNVSPQEVKKALNREGPLISSGLLCCQEEKESQLVINPFEEEEGITLLEGMAEVLIREHPDLHALFRGFFRMVESPSMFTLEHFPHLREEFHILVPLIESALRLRTPGMNFLVHGESGTGKSTLVAVLAQAIGATLYSVSSEKTDGAAMSDDRFGAYQLCQRILSRNANCVILFDEIEDVLPDEMHWLLGRPRRSGAKKAWTNRCLESNPVPAFWVTNEIRQIDNAFLGRFAYVLKVRNPPHSVRRKILADGLRGIPVSADWVTRVTAHPKLVPATIQRACQVANLVGSNEPHIVQGMVEKTIEGSLEARGVRVPGFANRYRTNVTTYSLDLVNSSTDLRQVVAGLKRHPHATLCLYGPPGTGKTEFARHLAREIDRPLIKKEASQLLSCWVGETEANLAEMFREASAEQAVLLLDEVDSFLRDRTSAFHSFEVTQVNELLVQMEAFEGVLICATNLMDILDVASLRRFDFKIGLDYLKPEQTWQLFQQVLAERKHPPLEPSDIATARVRLDQMQTLTPGTFCTVLRRSSVVPLPITWDTLLQALEQECKAMAHGAPLITGFRA